MKKYLLTLLASISFQSLALSADDFSGMENYIIIAETNVDDEFSGCEYDKKIRLSNGWVLTCATYRYSYSYRPDVIVFAKDIGRGYLIKALIDDDIYDMGAIFKK
ncbi:hypothetical protein JC794_08475 [Morganella morganii]|uniref:hypothetical protein n=1 Tax=Morganella morganii TaxID=582 RepID=UPI001C476F0D|nr:hypothetical protein [Morganella morganii]QXO59312.1 hypothetical protein JC827_08465 [Morganella morganii]QXO78281.1 hypothetical protein JC794_08475 [Morganella morganii]